MSSSRESDYQSERSNPPHPRHRPSAIAGVHRRSTSGETTRPSNSSLSPAGSPFSRRPNSHSPSGGSSGPRIRAPGRHRPRPVVHGASTSTSTGSIRRATDGYTGQTVTERAYGSGYENRGFYQEPTAIFPDREPSTSNSAGSLVLFSEDFPRLREIIGTGSRAGDYNTRIQSQKANLETALWETVQSFGAPAALHREMARHLARNCSGDSSFFIKLQSIVHRGSRDNTLTATLTGGTEGGGRWIALEAKAPSDSMETLDGMDKVERRVVERGSR